jgi:hypothetical protein
VLQRWTDRFDSASTPTALALSQDGTTLYWSREDGTGATRAEIDRPRAPRTLEECPAAS